jgi:hypothetical protein
MHGNGQTNRDGWILRVGRGEIGYAIIRGAVE